MLTFWLVTLAHGSDAVLDALQAELTRSRELSLPEAGSPYFVAYQLLEADRVYIEATLGGILWDSQRPDRSLGVEVRVVDSAGRPCPPGQLPKTTRLGGVSARRTATPHQRRGESVTEMRAN